MENKETKSSEDLNNLIGELDVLINKYPKIELFYKRAELLIKLGENAKAINDYNQIIKLDSNQQLAKSQIEYLSTILRFNNTDIYASPNTNFDPWLE